MLIDLVNPKGKIKKCKIGLSWTFLFFGPFVMLFRADWLSLFALAMINYVLGNLHPSAPWILTVLLVFLYNNYYIKKLIKAGWEPADKNSRKILEENNLLAI